MCSKDFGHGQEQHIDENKNLMKTFNMAKKLGLGLAMTGLVAWQAGATLDYTAINNNNGSTTLSPVVGSGSSGITIWKAFTVDTAGENLSLGKLGAFDNGLAAWGGNVVVSIDNVLGNGSLGSTVATVTFNSSTPGSQIGTSAFKFLTPTTGVGATLVNGDIYALVVSGLGTSANKYYNSGSSPGISQITASGNIAGDLDWSHSTTVDGVSHSGTFNSSNGDFEYGFGSFTFSELTPVPEASGFAVAAVALLGLVYVGRSYSRKLKVA